MATPKLKPGERAYLDAGSREMIYQGCSVNQLAEIFNMKTPDVMRRLAGLDPVGEGRQGNPIYRLRDAAARLVKIPVTPEMIQAHLTRMNPKDLPPVLNKMFWEGLHARRKYEEQTGELWSTADVMQVASSVNQSLQISIRLIPDLLHEIDDLSDEQLKLAQQIVDTALERARERLIRDLRKPSELGPGIASEEGEL